MLTQAEFMPMLEDVVNLPKGTLQGDEALGALAGWDSLAVVTFLVVTHKTTGVKVPPKAISGCQTVNQLYEAVCRAKAA